VLHKPIDGPAGLNKGRNVIEFMPGFVEAVQSHGWREALRNKAAHRRSYLAKKRQSKASLN
jgi:hypothetical protein